MTVLRIHRQRTKGWRMPPNTLSCTRPHFLGNPMTLANAVEAGYLRGPKDPLANLFLVDCFRDWLDGAGARGGRDWWSGPEADASRTKIIASIPGLRGTNLACFCRLCVDHAAGKPLGTECANCLPCHVDILLERANR